MQRNFITVFAIGLRGFAHRAQYILGHAAQFVQARVVSVSIGRIEQVFGEFGLQLRRFAGQLRVFGARLAFEQRTGQGKITQGMGHNVLARRRERSEIRCLRQCLIVRHDGFVLPQLRPKLGDLGQKSVVFGTPLLTVHHMMQVRDRAPNTRELLGFVVEKLHKVIPSDLLGR